MPSPDPDPDPVLNIAVMVEPGRLEWQAIVLISSLLAFGRGGFRLHCFCRAEKRAALQDTTRQFLDRYGLALGALDNPFRPEYPYGNKIIACDRLAAKHGNGRVLFLDTDVFLSRPFDFDQLDCPGVAAIAAGMPPPVGADLWPQIYAAFDLPMPLQRTIAQTQAIAMPPYYNAGLVLFRAETGFAAGWADCAGRLDAMDLPHKRPWLDQLALPVAAARCGADLTELPHAVNFNMNRANIVLPPDRVFLHYHKAHWLIATQYVRNLLNSLLPQMTQFANLRALFTQYDSLAEAYQMPL